VKGRSQKSEIRKRSRTALLDGPRLAPVRRRRSPGLRYWLPAAYAVLASLAWWDFATTAPDGLANIGLMVVVLPVTAIGLALGWAIGSEAFPLLPEGLGYLGSHAAYFAPSALLIALMLWRIGLAIDRALGARGGSGRNG
jgi:hypothetical protein